MAGCGCSGAVSKAVSLAGTSPQAANAAVILSAREAAGKRNAAAKGKAFASGLNAKAVELKRLSLAAAKAGKISQARKLAAEAAKMAAKAKAAGFVAFQEEKSAAELEKISHAVATALTYAMRGDSERSRQAFRVVGSLSGLSASDPFELVAEDQPPGLTDSLIAEGKKVAEDTAKGWIKQGMAEIGSWLECRLPTNHCDMTERTSWAFARYQNKYGIPPPARVVPAILRFQSEASIFGSINGSPPTEAEKRAILGPSAAEIEASRRRQIVQQQEYQRQAEARRQQQIRDGVSRDQIFKRKTGFSIPMIAGIGAGVLAIGGIVFAVTRK